MKRISQLNDTIADLELKHKNPITKTNEVLSRLTSCREELRQELRADYETYFKKLKLTYYSQSNRSGKLLAAQLKEKQARSNITHIKHHLNNTVFQNPKDIANVFKEYYESLYNLNTDSATHQHTYAEIDKFLKCPISGHRVTPKTKHPYYPPRS